MKKHLICVVLGIFTACCAFAGDAAAFVDMGFSQDGSTYVFGEYGKQDKTFEAYAEIYAVDVAKNDYISGEVFKTPASKETAAWTGKQVYESLVKKSEWKLKKYDCVPASLDNTLYVRESETQSPVEEIVFQDFEGSTVENPEYYHLKLVPTYTGSHADCKSSFFINVDKTDGSGNVLKHMVMGTPDIKRKGVTSYLIEKVFTDKSGKSLVILLSKKCEDSTGISIRYMVETIRL